MSEWVVNLIDGASYLGIAFLMFLETVFPPIPSEVIMSIAGIRTGQGELDYWLVVIAGTTGAMAGNFLWYLFARALGMERFHPFIDRWGRWLTVTWSEVEKAEVWFRRHGSFFVFLGRMLPTVRSLVSIPAGLLDMRMKTFLIASTIGTFGWTAMLAYAGYKLGENIDEIDTYLGPISTAIMVTLAVGYVWRLWTHRNIKRVRNERK